MGRLELATLVPAVIRSPLTDLDTTGDTPRTGTAQHQFLDIIFDG